MTITETTTVADIVSAHPSTVPIFERHRIDFCCGGRTPLGVACQEAGVGFTEVAAALEASALQPPTDGRDWASEPLPAIIDHIIATYHDALREELPRLEAMAAKVHRVHGSRAPHLAEIEAIVSDLSADLLQHMRKEEMVLFPAIRAIALGGEAGVPIAAPVSVMEHEHDHAGAQLAELHRLTEGYAVPDWACGTVRAFYYGLSELESTMHLHVHLENNVLFPRALGSVGVS